MKLHLKQHEITAAITMYLADQGIRVSNKSIDVSFTAGRKNSGLSAEVSIEDTVCENVPTIEEVLAFEQIPVLDIPEVAEVQESAFPNVTTEFLSTLSVDTPVPVKTTSLFS